MPPEINAFYEARRKSLRVNRMARPDDALALVAPTDRLSDHKKWQIWRNYGGSVFISHQSDDRKLIASNFVHKVKFGPLWYPDSAPLDIFFYNKAEGGEFYRELISHALLVCGSAVIFSSRNAVGSYWVPLECDIILARGIPFSAVALDETPLRAVHPSIAHYLGVVSRIRGHTKLFDVVRNSGVADAAVESRGIAYDLS